MTHSEAGFLGGKVTASRVDMRELGRRGGLLGGRPRNKTLDELLIASKPLQVNKITGGYQQNRVVGKSRNLKNLQREFLAKQKMMMEIGR